MQSFKPSDGRLLYAEKEMILRSKLYRIDQIVDNYFEENSNFNV